MNLNLCFLIGHNEKNTASLLDISAKDAKPDSTQKEVSKIKRRDILPKKKKNWLVHFKNVRIIKEREIVLY